MTVKKGIYWAFRIIALALAIKAGLWAFENLKPDRREQPEEVVLDSDKDCDVIADTGQCFCRHRWTEKRLSVPYQECVALSRQ